MKKKMKKKVLKKKLHKKKPSKLKKKSSKLFDMASIKASIQKELRSGCISPTEAQIKEQRAPVDHVINKAKNLQSSKSKEFISTNITGLDELLYDGIPKGAAILVAGGAGSGKTMMTLQMLGNHALKGKKCIYMSFEEAEKRLVEHMEDMGYPAKKLIKKGNLLIKRFNPFEITRSVDALLMEAKGELLIDVDPIILPKNFKPDLLVVDSLTAISSAFIAKEDTYRIYIEQLFRFLEKLNTTSFLITETEQIPTIFSTTGVEEFLADGVIVLYNLRKGNVRENAIEVLKLRGAKHNKKIVAMQIDSQGIVVYPKQEVYGFE
jgi:circadian clock protein KaiC